MSWFSDLTSKAEAMLVRLDQDAAQALQKPEKIFTGTRVLDKTTRVIDSSQDDRIALLETCGLEDDVIVKDIEDEHLTTKERGTAVNSHSYEHESGVFSPPASASGFSADETRRPPTHISETLDATTSVQHIHQSPGYTTQDQNQDYAIKDIPERTPEQTSKFDTPQQARKFKLQTSKLKQSSLKTNNKPKVHNEYNNGVTKVVSPGADDIRASINKSLQEYSLTASPFSRRSANEQTTFSSHFDDQPNLIRSDGSNNSRLSDRLQSSPSFSIDFPDNGSSTTDITDQILLQSALKRKSSFNLHRVLNKLAGNSVQSQAIIGDKTRIKLRRAQMRLASYMRRLNNYFRTYPTMKYWAIGYLVLLQLLVVYVLFFYKTTGSSSYLAAQVRQQQEELSEVNYPSRQKVISPSDIQSNSF